jgi:hypothetical protein
MAADVISRVLHHIEELRSGNAAALFISNRCAIAV